MKIFLLHCLLLSTFTANAQYSKKISITVRGGINAAHYNLPNEYAPSSSQRIITKGNVQNLQLGAFADIPLSKEIVFQTGLLLNGKGGKVQISRLYYQWEESASKPLYVELPLQFVYNVKISSSLNIFAGLGSYLAIGIGGENSYSGTYGDINPVFVATTNRIYYGDREVLGEGSYTTLNKVDYGLNFICGASFKNIQLYGNYGLGLKDVKSPSSEERDNMGKNRVISLGLGYTFKL